MTKLEGSIGKRMEGLMEKVESRFERIIYFLAFRNIG